MVSSNGFESSKLVRAGGNGSPCSRQLSAIARATSRAISASSTRLRPSTTSPGTSGLVATNPPSSKGSTCNRIAASLIKNRPQTLRLHQHQFNQIVHRPELDGISVVNNLPTKVVHDSAEPALATF